MFVCLSVHDWCQYRLIRHDGMMANLGQEKSVQGSICQILAGGSNPSPPLPSLPPSPPLSLPSLSFPPPFPCPALPSPPFLSPSLRSKPLQSS